MLTGLLHNTAFLAGVTIATLAYGNKTLSLVIGAVLIILGVVLG